MIDYRFFLFIVLCWGTAAFGARSPMLEKFDHDAHVEGVFAKRKVDCSQCHSMRSDPSTRKLTLTEITEKSAFRTGLKEMCHECHKSTLAVNQQTPQNCFLCHSSKANLDAIKPRNHDNVTWKKSHATEGRNSGDSCLNCHTTSQCVRCHTQRNDVELRAHTRNFRFTHSVEARLQPQRCDTCHTKSFCIDCHMRKR